MNTTNDMQEPGILSVKDLHIHFNTNRGTVKAVNGVNFSIRQGESVGIVGESGCGKTVTALSMLRLVPKPCGRIVKGKISFNDNDIIALSEKELRKIRGEHISMIFQDPMTSLNPAYVVGNQLGEVLRLHRSHLNNEEIRNRCLELLHSVEIPMAKLRLRQYPHELSGGMRQRVMIAIALACNPKFLIADEPTTALDVTIQAQIMELINKLRHEKNSGVILITHDLGLIAENTDRVVVMYTGKIIEEGPVEDVIEHPFHPYTKGLLRSIPRMSLNFGEVKQRLYEIPGRVPSLVKLPSGCTFAPRCPECMDICREKFPQQRKVGFEHRAWCWL
jgi:oligopeptide/dipeptide ABC transporter ATP-binding protein